MVSSGSRVRRYRVQTFSRETWYLAWLQEHRAEIVQWPNADYFKPWFPMKMDGRVVEDLGDMTYKETVLRLVRLIP